MPTITEIRVRNLNQLVKSHKTVRALAEAIDRAPAVVSQMRNGRSFGEKIARHTEKALNLPAGYLDTEHSENDVPLDKLLTQIKSLFDEQHLSPEEKIVIQSFRLIPQNKRGLAISFLKELQVMQSKSAAPSGKS